MKAGLGHVVCVQKFPAGLAGPPNGHARRAADFRLMKFADHGRRDMTREQIEIILGPVKIGGHHADEIRLELPVVGLAGDDARDFGDSAAPNQESGGFVFSAQGGIASGKSMRYFRIMPRIACTVSFLALAGLDATHTV